MSGVQITLVRIDDRLIHGQVVLSWIPHVRAEVVLVASDAAAQDETAVALMQMAVPDTVELRVLPVPEAARQLSAAPADARRTLVLAPGPKEVLSLLEHGACFSRVNVGGLHYSAGRVQLGKAIFLSEDDKDALRRISRRGVALEGRALPSDAGVDIIGMMGGPGGAA
ncbi:MAG: PTS sugar transporter subunit IIB [Elusimicrobiota bacterium]|mgnify:FL=1